MIMIIFILIILFVLIYFSASFFTSNLVKSISYSIKNFQEDSPLYTEAKEFSEKYAKCAAIGLISSLTIFVFIAYFIVQFLVC